MRKERVLEKCTKQKIGKDRAFSVVSQCVCAVGLIAFQEKMRYLRQCQNVTHGTSIGLEIALKRMRHVSFVGQAQQ